MLLEFADVCECLNLAVDISCCWFAALRQTRLQQVGHVRISYLLPAVLALVVHMGRQVHPQRVVLLGGHLEADFEEQQNYFDSTGEPLGARPQTGPKVFDLRGRLNYLEVGVV
jgi:hypothetical protein